MNWVLPIQFVVEKSSSYSRKSLYFILISALNMIRIANLAHFNVYKSWRWSLNMNTIVSCCSATTLNNFAVSRNGFLFTHLTAKQLIIVSLYSHKYQWIDSGKTTFRLTWRSIYWMLNWFSRTKMSTFKGVCALLMLIAMLMATANAKIPSRRLLLDTVRPFWGRWRMVLDN